MWQMLTILNLGEGYIGYTLYFQVFCGFDIFQKKVESVLKRTVLCFNFSNSKMGIIELVLSVP